MEPTSRGGFDGGRVPPEGLAQAFPDPVAVLGPDGRIAWANAPLSDLLGVPLTTLVGAGALDLVPPEELARAVDGIRYATTFPDRTALVAYRLLRPDGRRVPVEITSSVQHHPDGDHLVLSVRDATARTTLADALRTVIGGEPFDRTAQLVAEAAGHRWPNGAAAVTWVESGRRRWAGPPGPALAGAGPWEDPPEDDRCEVCAIDVLDPTTAARLRRDGVGAVAVARIPAPEGPPAALVGLFDSDEVARLEFVHAAEEFIEVCQLALAHRHNLSRLDHAARHDQLTGLPNRRAFLEALHAVLDGGEPAGVIFVDLDGFKLVNDRWGHRVGDGLLAAAARRLADVDGATVVARLGGDEFGALLRAPVDRGAVESLAERLVGALAEPFGPGDLPEGQVRLGASAGATIGEPGTPFSGILEAADRAMYEAKAAGGGWRWSG